MEGWRQCEYFTWCQGWRGSCKNREAKLMPIRPDRKTLYPKIGKILSSWSTSGQAIVAKVLPPIRIVALKMESHIQ